MSSLHLRPYRSEDEPKVRSWLDEPECAMWVSGKIERLLEPFATCEIWVVVDQGSDVGLVACEPRNDAVTVAVLITERCRRRGVALGALHALERIPSYSTALLVAEIDEENLPSAKLFHRAGYAVTERARGWIVMSKAAANEA